MNTVYIAGLVWLLATSVGGSAQGKETKIKLGNNYRFLLKTPEIVDELEITPHQTAELSAIEKQIEKHFSKWRPGAGANQANEIQLRVADLEAELRDILLPHQQKRLRQLSLQLRILPARTSFGLLHREIVNTLEIRENQQTRIREKSNELSGKSDELANNARKKIRAMQEQANKDLVEVLTMEQLEKYRNLFGPTFDLGK